MPDTIQLGAVGPGKLNLPPRSSDPTAPSIVSGLVVAMDLRTIGPGKLRLPPRDYGSSVASSALPLPVPAPLPGPGISPSAMLQFQASPRSSDARATFINISGLFGSNSTVYGSIGVATLPVATVPRPGAPGPGPYNDLQFTSFPFDTSNPSATSATLQGGQLVSNSLFYATLTGTGELDSVLLPASLWYGNGVPVAAGVMGGAIYSNSTLYAALSGLGELDGAILSNSLLIALQVGSGYQPFVPNTAVLDVRGNRGYEPWIVKPGKTIG